MRVFLFCAQSAGKNVCKMLLMDFLHTFFLFEDDHFSLHLL